MLDAVPDVEPAAGPEQAVSLTKSRHLVEKEHRAELADDGIERAVAERQHHRVGLPPEDIGGARPRDGEVQHRLVESCQICKGFIYLDLTHRELPQFMPPRERREVDAVLVCEHTYFILEYDEVQHFNPFRAKTLRHYMRVVPLSFDPDLWLKRSEEKRRLEGGGFATPKPPLFPEAGGRHLQRAFRDALCDVVPLYHHGFAPTLRIAHFEVGPWLYESDALSKMSRIVEARLS